MDGILLINKNKGVTSRYIVNKLTHLLNTKKIGHTGTLDPLAEGVLVICVGRCTKLVELLTSSYKEYIATIKLGIKTDTKDITGKILEEKEVSLEEKEIQKVLKSFLGKSIQEVPIYSAVRVNGKKLYEYARKNIDVELPKREIDIKEIELLNFKNDEIKFRVLVSKGTYIRSLVEDICYKLNTIGTMSSLIRTKQGKFNINDCYTIEDIEKNNYKLLSKEDVIDIEKININEEIYNKVKNGAIIPKIFNNDLCALTYKNEIIAIYKTYNKDNQYAKPYKML